MLTGCLQSTTTMQSLGQNATCTTSGARISSARTTSLVQRIAVPREEANTACESARNYVCTRALFSPDVQDGRSISSECIEAGSLGSPCLDVDSQNFDTRAAIQSASIDPSAPGTYNHAEYSCYNSALKAADSFPANGIQYATLTEALQAAHKRCGDLVAALPSGQ
jgi:hypothetical protein